MTIVVCPLSQVAHQIALHRPSRVISLLDPDSLIPDLGPTYDGKHLQLRFHDVQLPTDGQILPSAEHVDRLLRFLNARSPSESLLIHCRAGIGRSPAAAFIAACYLNPSVPEHKIAAALRRAAPFARPNDTLIHLADTVLAREGRMINAISSTGRNLTWTDIEEGEAFQLSCAYH
jgi:predicted protein tyrosine phosphatase